MVVGGDDDVQTVTPAPVAAVITAADLVVTTPENPEAGATLGTVQATVSNRLSSVQFNFSECYWCIGNKRVDRSGYGCRCGSL